MMEAGKKKSTLASKIRSVYNKARFKFGKQQKSDPADVTEIASSPPKVVVTVPTTTVANAKTADVRTSTGDSRNDERHQPKQSSPASGTINQDPPRTENVAFNEKWKNVPTFQKAVKLFEEEYKELSAAISQTTSPTKFARRRETSDEDVPLSIGSIDPEVREKALTILSKTSMVMNKWVGYESAQARAIATINSEEMKRLEEALLQLHIQSLATVGSIYQGFRKSGPNLITQSQIPEFERKMSQLDRLDRICTTIKDRMDNDLKLDETVGRVILWIKDKHDPEPSNEAVMEQTGLSNDTLAANWLLHTSQFASLEQKLSQDEDGQVFWLNGMMGSGKTTLICRIISHFQSFPIPGLRIVHYYCYGNTTSNGALGISYQNIIRGLCSKLVWNNDNGELSPCARDFYKRCHPIQGERTPTTEEWKQLLKGLVAESRTLFIIDALDECRLPDRNHFLNTIGDLRKDLHLNIIFSSRGHVEAKPFFGEEFVNYPVTTPEAREDMEKFIGKRISEIKADPVRSNSILFKNKDLSKRLVEALNEHAGGMQVICLGRFRWVEVWLGVLLPLDHDPIAQSDVAKSKLEILESARTLKNLSNEADLMKQAYQQLWDTNARDERRRCHQIRLFQFLLGALEPMTPQMLLEAICFDPKQPTEFSRELEIDYIEKLYHNFLSAKDEVLIFEHISAKTFILELVDQENKQPLFADEILNHSVIAESSLLLLREPKHPIWDRSGFRWNSNPTTMSLSEFKLLRSNLPDWSPPTYWDDCLGAYIVTYWERHCSILKGSRMNLELSQLWSDILKNFPSTLKCLDDQSQYWGHWVWSPDFPRSLVLADNNQVMVDPLLFALNFSISPFHCRDRLDDVVERLGNIMARNLEGATALHIAVQQDDLISVEALLKMSLQRNPGRKLIHARDNHGQNALHHFRSGSVVKALLQFEAKIAPSPFASGEMSCQGCLLKSKDDRGETPMIKILEVCSQEFILSIITNWQVKIDQITDERGYLPWEVIIQRGLKEVAKLFLEQGADINFTDKTMGTPLMIAALYKDIDIAKVLLGQGADVKAIGGRLGTALESAAYANDLDMAVLLLSRGADVNAIGGEFGTALGAAAYWNELKMVELLLMEGADVDAIGGRYGTALGNAVLRNELDMIKYLLSQGADINAIGGEYGTALGVAAFHGYTHTWSLKLLLRKGANVNAVGGLYGTALGAFISQNPARSISTFKEYQVDIDLAIREWPDRESWTEAGESSPEIASAWAQYESNCGDLTAAVAGPS